MKSRKIAYRLSLSYRPFSGEPVEDNRCYIYKGHIDGDKTFPMSGIDLRELGYDTVPYVIVTEERVFSRTEKTV